MRYIFVDESWEDYLFWQKTDKKVVAKINELCELRVENKGNVSYGYAAKDMNHQPFCRPYF